MSGVIQPQQKTHALWWKFMEVAKYSRLDSAFASSLKMEAKRLHKQGILDAAVVEALIMFYCENYSAGLLLTKEILSNSIYSTYQKTIAASLLGSAGYHQESLKYFNKLRPGAGQGFWPIYYAGFVRGGELPPTIPGYPDPRNYLSKSEFDSITRSKNKYPILFERHCEALRELKLSISGLCESNFYSDGNISLFGPGFTCSEDKFLEMVARCSKLMEGIEYVLPKDKFMLYHYYSQILVEPQTGKMFWKPNRIILGERKLEFKEVFPPLIEVEKLSGDLEGHYALRENILTLNDISGSLEDLDGLLTDSIFFLWDKYVNGPEVKMSEKLGQAVNYLRENCREVKLAI